MTLLCVGGPMFGETVEVEDCMASFNMIMHFLMIKGDCPVGFDYRVQERRGRAYLMFDSYTTALG